MDDIRDQAIERARREGLYCAKPMLMFVGNYPRCSCGYEPAAEEAGYSASAFENLLWVHGVRTNKASWRTRLRLKRWKTKHRRNGDG